MAGFRKAQPQQAAIKMSGYGPPGSGKTFTTLLFAEGLAKKTGKRIAYVDTERGTDFYALPVADRKAHPEAFDFDAIYTRSLVEITKELREKLDRLCPIETQGRECGGVLIEKGAVLVCQKCKSEHTPHGIIIIDSVSHLWDTAIAAYSGNKTKAGTIPMWAWSKIKAPYKDLVKFLIDSPHHVFLLGRQANAFEEDTETGEVKAAGVKMRAEGETAYEPHICLHFCPAKNKKTNEQIIQAIAEKDRSGILSGKVIQWPTFEKVIGPVLGILGTVQGHTPSDDEAATADAEANAQAERDKAKQSHELKEKYLARMSLAEDLSELKKIASELTPAVKKNFSALDLATVRTAWATKESQLKGAVSFQEQIQREDEAALAAVNGQN